MRNYSKKLKIMLLLTLLLVIFVSLVGCTEKEPSVDSTAPKKLVVVTTLYPLAEFAHQVGKDKVNVINLIPPGVEAHQWEPNPKDIRTIIGADLFIYNGNGFEAWVPKVLTQLQNSKVLEITEGMELLEDNHENHNHAEHDVKSDEECYDPHIWLDPLMAVKMVSSITKELIELDSNHEEDYRRNSQTYIDRLLVLDKKFAETTSKFEKKDFVVTHASFGYLAKRYGLNQIAILGISPDVEPSPKDMANLIKISKEKRIEYIFFETLVSPKLAKTLANEIGAKTLVLNPLEGLTTKELKEGQTYISTMEANLENLQLALEK